MSVLEGRGLHRGQPARMRFSAEPGAVRFRSWTGDVEARRDELVFDGASRSTSAATPDGRLRIGTVEHLFAALAACSIRDGIVIAMDGPEVPLVDGGARVFVEQLAALGIAPSPPTLAVARAATIEVGASLYELAPHDGVRVEVEIDFADARLLRHARWDGDFDDFYERIAPARTFGFEHELEELLARDLAKHVAPESVVVIARDRVLTAGRSFQADEPARHKLLDLIGDLYAHGGPPRGRIRALRPGHAATHEAMRQAFARGLIVKVQTE